MSKVEIPTLNDFKTSINLEFKIVKEAWNEYEVDDDGESVKLRGRIILNKVMRTTRYDKKGDPIYLTGTQNIFTTTAPVGLKSEPTTREISTKERFDSIISELDFKTIKEVWNEYHLQDGTIFRLKIVASGVQKTKFFSSDGDPLYNVTSSTVSRFIVPSDLKRSVK